MATASHIAAGPRAAAGVTDFASLQAFLDDVVSDPVDALGLHPFKIQLTD